MSVSDNRKLTVTITPQVDINALMSQLSNIPGVMMDANLARSQVGLNSERSILENQIAKKDVKETQESLSAPSGTNKGQLDENKMTEEAKKERRDKLFQNIHGLIQQGFQAAVGAMTTMQGFIQQMYQKIRASSEFLQTVESLFQLGMTLLFMPLANALAETILPCMLDFVDGILGMWEDFETFAGAGSLDEMLDMIFTTGLETIGKLFDSIGDKLSTQDGILGTIGVAIEAVGEILKGDTVAILHDLLKIMTAVMNHIGIFISLYVAYKTTELAMSAMGIWGDLTGAKLGVGVAGGVRATIFAASAIGAGRYLNSNDIPVFANGGEVKSDGLGNGQIVRVAEWEDEYIIPKSKMGSTGQTVINNYFSGYNEDQLINKINDTINAQIAESRYRSTY